ncbi:hypothetical protein [Phytohalomonas tamaricis]|uniref:hypothetical protein n=1 Tax=Phytohalomonas tamaricis TaxID=2081032 RepID=UPI000D0B3197|nr:hypothetical protein [Phytohalomonas tamaricis]
MKRIMLGALSLGLLAGCSSPHYVVAPGLMTQQEGTVVVQRDNGNYLSGVSFRRLHTPIDETALRSCLVTPAQTGTASARNSVPFTFHDIVISEDLDTNQAQGSVSTELGVLTYRLELQLIQDTNYYYFDQLQLASNGQEQAAVGAWEDADPKTVHDALEQVTDTLQNCFARLAAPAPAQ